MTSNNRLTLNGQDYDIESLSMEGPASVTGIRGILARLRRTAENALHIPAAPGDAQLEIVDGNMEDEGAVWTRIEAQMAARWQMNQLEELRQETELRRMEVERLRQTVRTYSIWQGTPETELPGFALYAEMGPNPHFHINPEMMTSFSTAHTEEQPRLTFDLLDNLRSTIIHQNGVLDRMRASQEAERARYEAINDHYRGLDINYGLVVNPIIFTEWYAAKPEADEPMDPLALALLERAVIETAPLKATGEGEFE